MQKGIIYLLISFYIEARGLVFGFLNRSEGNRDTQQNQPHKTRRVAEGKVSRSQVGGGMGTKREIRKTESVKEI